MNHLFQAHAGGILALLCGAVVSLPVCSLATDEAGAPKVEPTRFVMASLGIVWPERMTLPAAYQPPRLLSLPWKTSIVTTVFWCGELPTPKNPTTNVMSSWDPEWRSNFGGYDDPDNRTRSFTPVGFVPKRNPFYVALPFNDCIDGNTTKSEAAAIIPWFKSTFKRHGQSVCHNRWIAIRHGDRVCYAQWSDCGPFTTEDSKYVFGDAPPSNTKNNGAGLDISPAVRDHLGFQSGGRCDWRFVDLHEVPDGPWKQFGDNNPFTPTGQQNIDLTPVAPFVPSANSSGSSRKSASSTSSASAAKAALSGAARLEELKRQRDAWFRTK